MKDYRSPINRCFYFLWLCVFFSKYIFLYTILRKLGFSFVKVLFMYFCNVQTYKQQIAAYSIGTGKNSQWCCAGVSPVSERQLHKLCTLHFHTPHLPIT